MMFYIIFPFCYFFYTKSFVVGWLVLWKCRFNFEKTSKHLRPQFFNCSYILIAVVKVLSSKLSFYIIQQQKTRVKVFKKFVRSLGGLVSCESENLVRNLVSTF